MEVGTKSPVSPREGQTTARASRVSWLGLQTVLLLLPDEVFAQMLARKRPFEKVPESTLVSSPEVLGTMAGEANYAGFRARLREVRPSPGVSVAIEHQGIAVRFFELPHLAHELYQVRVVAHLVRHGGVSVLHVGDAELTAAHLAGLGLHAEKIDVAILPYWFFKQPDARALVDQHIGAKRLVAMRLPQGGLEEAQRAIAAAFPEVVVLTRPLESTKL